MGVEQSLGAGSAALQAGRWSEARDAFESALQERETAEALLGMGEALWWLGESRLSVEYYQRAYVQFRRAGDLAQAAWAAMWLCLSYKADFGNQVASSGWIARAERVLQDVDPGPYQGWLWLIRAYDSTDLAFARDLLERTLAFARDSGDLDLELCALADLGERLVALGQLEQGFALVDEAMAGVLGGERTRLDTVVFTSCAMLTACELASDLERATQWCRVADAFIQEYGCPFLYARCRTAYGSVLVATGHWAEAERELTAVIRVGRDVCPAMRALALTRLADLRLRQGRLEAAEALLAGVDDALTSALPAAALRLAHGEPAVAIVILQRRLKLFGEHHLEAAPILELLVEAQLASGDRDAAAESVDRLSALVSAHERDHVAARAAGAAARVLLARGETEAAIGQLETALERFSRLNLPHETARYRLLLAQTLANQQPAVALAESRRALTAFETLGAAADVDAAAALLRSLGVRGRPGPKGVGMLTRREQEVLHLVGLGYSNPEIAERLVISRKTASHHVSSLLAKLGLRNRAQAVAYATRTLEEPIPN